MKASFVISAVFCTLVAAEQYPSAYPFENEAYVPTELIPGTPNLTYDPATDTGGYTWYYWVGSHVTLTEEEFPLAAIMKDFFAYGMVNHFKAPASLPVEFWNCTAKEFMFSASDFTGKVYTSTVCGVGQCCSHLYGKPKFGEDQPDWHEWLTGRISTSLCGDLMEESYCVLVAGDYETNCLEYLVTPTERLVTYICHDSWVLFYLSCEVMKTSYQLTYVSEPPAYTNQMSVADTMLLDTVTSLGDKICQPYSYFHPEKTATSNESPTETSSSAVISRFVAISAALLLL